MRATTGAIVAMVAASSLLLVANALAAEDAAPAATQSEGLYRLPFPDGAWGQVFDDFASHRPIGRLDLYGTNDTPPFKVVEARASAAFLRRARPDRPQGPPL